MGKVAINSDRFLLTTPVVMLSACGNEKQPNIITLAWCGVICSDPPMVYASIRPSRHTYSLLKENGDFVINVPSQDQLEVADLCGVVSGKKDDKFDLCNFSAEISDVVKAPMIAECPVNIECRTRQILELGVHHAFVAEVMGIKADESVLDETGKTIDDFAPPVYSTGSRSYHKTELIEDATYGFSKKS